MSDLLWVAMFYMLLEVSVPQFGCGLIQNCGHHNVLFNYAVYSLVATVCCRPCMGGAK